jgi:hypothetical protein
MAVWHSVEGVRWAVVVVASLLAGDLDTYFKLILLLYNCFRLSTCPPLFVLLTKNGGNGCTVINGEIKRQVLECYE